MTGHGADTYRFGDCELDLARREFRRGGEVVAIEPRVFALLVYLVEQRQRAVDKDAIQDAVWAGTIVSETALTRAIMKARRAVGDSPDKQAVIRTVHGHGYQFVAALAEETAPGPDESAPAEARSTLPRVIAALAVLALIGLVAFLWPAASTGGVVRLAVMPVQNQTGDPEFDWARLGLMGFANDMLQRSGALDVVPASDVMQFAEQHRDGNGEPDVEILRDNYGASHVLSSSLERNAGVLRLSYTLLASDGKVERGTMVGAEPTELTRGMIRSIGMTLGRRAATVREITVVSDDPFINEAYSRALGLSLEGRCAEALQLFEIVLSSDGDTSRAEYEWASCARVLGRWQEAEAAFQKLVDAIPAEPASGLRALALNGLGTVYLRTGRRDAARDTYRQGLEQARQAGDYRAQGMLLNNLAIDARNRREYDEARELLARASLAHSESGAGILPGQVPAALANIDMAEGRLEQAENHLQQALAAFRALGDRRNEAMMLNNFGYLRRLQGRLDDAEPLHLQSLAIRREIGDRVGQGNILGMLSILYVENGRLDEARQAATEAYQIASEANDRLFMATGLAQLAAVEQSAGDLEEARRVYLESKAIFEEIDDYSRSAQVSLRLAQLEFAAGELGTARATMQQVLDMSLREAMHEPAIEAMELDGDIAREEGDAAQAIAAYQRALGEIDESGFVSRKTPIVVKLANVLLDVGDVDAVEPLIGYLVEQEESEESLALRDRYRSVVE